MAAPTLAVSDHDGSTSRFTFTRPIVMSTTLHYVKPCIVDGGDAKVRTRGAGEHSMEALFQKLPGPESTVGTPSEPVSTNQVG
jgi:hypothetical protein